MAVMERPGGGSEQVKTVVLFGRSLAVSSIGASLKGCAGLRVLAVEAGVPDAARRLAALRPDVVLFDLAAIPSDFAVALWKARPGTLLIGVDLLTDRALVLAGRTARAHTTEDLLDVFQRGKRGHGDAGTRRQADAERS